MNHRGDIISDFGLLVALRQGKKHNLTDKLTDTWSWEFCNQQFIQLYWRSSYFSTFQPSNFSLFFKSMSKRYIFNIVHLQRLLESYSWLSKWTCQCFYFTPTATTQVWVMVHVHHWQSLTLCAYTEAVSQLEVRQYRWADHLSLHSTYLCLYPALTYSKCFVAWLCYTVDIYNISFALNSCLITLLKVCSI